MAAAARLCRLLPTGRKNVVASLVIDFRLHVRQAQVVSVGVPATIHRRVQLAKHSQVRSALPLAARLCRFHRSTSGRLLPTGRKNVVASLVIDFRLHVLEAQVVSVRVPLTIYGRVQLAKHSQVRSALPLAARLFRFHRSTSGRLLPTGRKKA